MSEPVFVVVDVLDVAVEWTTNAAHVILREVDGARRSLVVPVAMSDGHTIFLATQRHVGRRPSSGELTTDLLAKLRCDIVSLRLTHEVDGVYFAELTAIGPHGSVVVDCRPSDGLVLSLRQGVRAPVLVEESLFL